MKERVADRDVEREVDLLGPGAPRRRRACAASMRRKRAIATAKGFLSTPWTEVRALLISSHWSVSPDCVLPGSQEAVECAEQEVAAAAGGVDDAEAAREVP